MNSYYSLKVLFVGVILNYCHAVQEEVTSTMSGVPYRLSTQTPTPLRRIEFVSVTVDDLELSSQFYGDVLGGFEVQFCEVGDTSNYCDNSGAVKFSGDEHMSAMFVNTSDSNNPDISTSGEYEVLSKFFIIGNSLIQLIEFATKSDGSTYNLRESMTSPCWLSKAHLDFWIENDIDANQYVADVEARAAALGGGGLDVKFNRPVPLETRQDRDSVPVEQYTNKVIGGPFDGLAWAYFKGPSTEQLEIYQIDRTIAKGIGAAYCARGAVSTGFVNSDVLQSNTSKYGWGGGEGSASEKNYTSQMIHGLFQYGYRTGDLHSAVGFYSEILGGDLITHPTQGIEIMRDDSAHWMILGNETLEAYEYSDGSGGTIDREEALRIFGVANISSLGHARLDHRFILFDNFVVEPLKYTDGLTFGGTAFNPTLDSNPSPAFIGTITAAFGVDRNTSGMNSLSEYIGELPEKLARQGYTHKVKLSNAIASFSQDHPYRGLEYSFISGPDDEAIQLVFVGGYFQEKLRLALIESGGVSTMFSETNPYLNGDMDAFCPYALYTPQYATMTSSSSEQCSSTSTYYYDTTDNDGDTWSLSTILILVIGALSFGLSLYVTVTLHQLSRRIHDVSLSQLRETRSGQSMEKTSNPIL